jgi:hypothetical protein
MQYKVIFHASLLLGLELLQVMFSSNTKTSLTPYGGEHRTVRLGGWSCAQLTGQRHRWKVEASPIITVNCLNNKQANTLSSFRVNPSTLKHQPMPTPADTDTDFSSFHFHFTILLTHSGDGASNIIHSHRCRFRVRREDILSALLPYRLSLLSPGSSQRFRKRGSIARAHENHFDLLVSPTRNEVAINSNP